MVLLNKWENFKVLKSNRKLEYKSLIKYKYYKLKLKCLNRD